MIENLSAKRYLGDGVYVGFDGYQLWLSTQEGNSIALEPSVMLALLDYTKRLRETIERNTAGDDLPREI